MKPVVATLLLVAFFQAVVTPAAAQTEVGANDFKISGLWELSELDPPANAGPPAVAYNSTDHEYLVVWRGTALRDASFCPIDPVSETREIKGQRFDAMTGDPIGDPVRISNTCDPSVDVDDPAVAYNETDNEYLVVWSGAGARYGEYEIFGQRLNANGTEQGANDFRISDMGGTGISSYDANQPAVAYNPVDNVYLVVWWGNDDVGGLSVYEDEIFGQLLDHDGGALGVNDFRISDMGVTGDDFDPHFAYYPAVAHNPTDNEYLVVWYGQDNVGGLVFTENEIFGQRLNANGTEQGANDFRISDMGGTGDGSFQAYQPAVAYNPVDNEYLVVWHGDDNVGGLVNNEDEIFGQRLDHQGGEVGANDFRISDMGGTGGSGFGASTPAVAYNPLANGYLVVWYGDDNVGGLVNEEYEIFGQLLDSEGGELGANDFRISDMGGTGTNGFDAVESAVAFAPPATEYLVVWRGDDDEDGGVDDEWNVFGQRIRELTLFRGGFESGGATRWSDVQPPPA